MTSKGLKDFNLAIVNNMSNLLLPKMEKQQSEIGKTLTNHLLDLDGPKTLEKDFSPDEKYLGKLFYGFIEISNSFEVLLDIEILISRFPYNRTRISRVRYLRHNIEGFLNEVYLLKERMVSYTKIIERYHRKENIKRVCKKLRENVEKTLHSVIIHRGSHVHRMRYTDEKLDRLEMLDLLVKDNPASRFRYYYDQKYKEYRKEWKTKIDRNNNGIKKLLDYYCNKLFDFVFDDNDEIKLRKQEIN